MSISLRHVRYFVAAAETGQISRAAIDLSVSQSAVTAAVQQLEAQVGTRLFERHAQGVTLTLEGSRFMRHARSIVASMNEAMRVGRDPTRQTSGTIRVGVTYTVVGYFIAQHLARFVRSFPGIDVVLSEAARPSIEQGLISGELDTAVILTSNLENADELESETLIRSRRKLWLAPDHPLQKAPAVYLADIAKEPYIMLNVDEAARTADRYWKDSGVMPQAIFETSSVEAVRSMVANGMGVTILSDMVFRPWSLDGQRIETRTVSQPVPSMDVGLAWPRGAELSAPARAFRDFLSLSVHGGSFATEAV